MQINITLFLQIINFFITYWFLNKFMFRPIMDYIKKRNEEDADIKNNIKEKENLLIYFEKEKHESLLNFKVSMKEKYKVSPYSEPKVPSDISIIYNKKESEKILEEAKSLLIERVPHVD